MVYVKPNSNFYLLAKGPLADKKTAEYQIYRQNWQDYPANFIVRDFPMHLDIETTSRCNLTCNFCDKLQPLAKEQLGDMDIKLYKKIIDEGSKNRLWGIKLSYRGEPLLHKDIIEIVSYAKEKGILDVYFNTNGTLLTEQISGALIDAGLDRVSISADGFKPEVFKKQRSGIDFQVILANIENLLKLRRKKGVNHPRIRVQTVYFSDIDLKEYKLFWETRCDEVAAIDYKDGKLRQAGIVYDWACPQLWQRMTICWDGSIIPCNNDDLNLFGLGNIKQRSIYECWHDQRAMTARLLHQQGRSHEVRACDGCPWRTAQIKKLKKLG